MKSVAQFDGHEVSADGVMNEILHAFGDSGLLLAVFDEDQLRDLLSKFGTAPANVRENNRLELLYLLSNKVTSERSEAALIVGQYITQHFGMDSEEDNLAILCEDLLEYSSLSDDADDEEDQVTCDSCGDEFDRVGRCSCATSYDFDEDHEEEHPVIKAKEGSQVLDVNYANFLSTIADDDLLDFVPAIISSQGDNTFSLHTAQEVRLFLQQAKSVELRTVLRYLRDPEEGEASDLVEDLTSSPVSEQHLIVINMLGAIGVDYGELDVVSDDAVDEQTDSAYNTFVNGLRDDVLNPTMVAIDDYTDDVFSLTTSQDVRQWLLRATKEELMGVWDTLVQNGVAENDDYVEQNREFFSERYEVLVNILTAVTGDDFGPDEDDEADDETYALRS